MKTFRKGSEHSEGRADSWYSSMIVVVRASQANGIDIMVAV